MRGGRLFAVFLKSVCYSKRQTNTKLSTHYLIQTIQSMQLILCILRRLTNPLNTGENSKPLFFVNFSSLEQQRLRISVYSDNDGKKENPTSNHNRNKKKKINFSWISHLLIQNSNGEIASSLTISMTHHGLLKCGFPKKTGYSDTREKPDL